MLTAMIGLDAILNTKIEENESRRR